MSITVEQTIENPITSITSSIFRFPHSLVVSYISMEIAVASEIFIINLEMHNQIKL
jgi:hypothetical protein